MANILVVFVYVEKNKESQIKKAFTCLQRASLPCQLVSSMDILSKSEKDNYLYVCDPFEGEAFEHLVKLGCRIVGPQCVLNCMRQTRAIPKSDGPVYNISMRGLVISCTSLAKSQRSEIRRLVQYMGGSVMGDFTENVTHLVAGEVGSKKYHVAVSLGKPVMLPEWVTHCWDRSKTKYQLHATDDEFNDFCCPIFKGCVICVSGLDSEKRTDVSVLANKNGGKYSGELRQNECTHLVVDNPHGQKYEFAMKWKLHCVTSKWFYDSLEKGACLDESLYKVVRQVKGQGTSSEFVRPTSTPKKKSRQRAFSSIGDVSNISMASTINDTVMSVDLQLPPPENLFLDGCKIFMCGFNVAELERLQRMINIGGGSRFNHYGDSVTHVVMGIKDVEIIKKIEGSESRPYVVTAQWLVESYTGGEKLDEKLFEYMNTNSVDDVDVRNESIVKLKSKQSNNSVRDKKTAKVKPVSHDNNDGDDDDITLMEQYLPQNTTAGNTTTEQNASSVAKQQDDADETSDQVAMEVEDADVTMDHAEKRDGGDDDNDDVAMVPGDENMKDEEEGGEDEGDMLEGNIDGIFSLRTFVVVGFEEEQRESAEEMITMKGGKIKTSTSRTPADIAIVPLISCCKDLPAKHVVNNCWLQMCYEHDAFLPVDNNELFLPFDLAEDCQPLKDCVISISQYVGVERDCIQHLAECLGAIVQDYFVRKKKDDVTPNTHLILQEPMGHKYLAAVKWKLPAVDKRWLLECVRRGEKVAEDEYIIGEARGNVSKNTSINKSQRTDSTAQKRQNGQDNEPNSDKKMKMSPENDNGNNNTDRHQRRTSPQQKTSPQKDSEQNSVSTKTGVVEISTQQRQTSSSSKSAKKVLPVPQGPVDASFLYKKDFKPTFDLTDALAYLATPPGQKGKGRRRKSSLPLDVMFSNQMQKAVERTGNGPQEDASRSASNITDDEEVFFKKEEKGVLDGVVICVSKKLSKQQSDYNTMATGLGAEYIWTYDNSCTHFIYKGRNNDSSKEYRQVKEHGKQIVHPNWLTACHNENKYVDESLYPHTYNPKMSLVITTQRRLTRSSCKMQSNDDSSSDDDEENDADKTKMKDEKEEDEDIEKRLEDEMPHTLEIQQDFKRQFEEIMTTAMTNKGTRRKSRRLNNSTGNNSGVHGQDQDSSATESSSGAKTRSTRLQSRKSNYNEAPPEASQTVQITWDDPTGREERLKIMEKLQGGNSIQTEDDDDVRDENDKEEETQNEDEDEETGQDNEEEHNISSTPEAPPVRLPLARPAVAMAPEERAYKPPEKPRFLLSSMTQQEKIDYSGLIEELGGTVSETQYYDSTCTHVVVGNPTRNEKYLAALASGKWVLHKSYLEACRQSREFVQEEDHEWGSATDIQKLPLQTAKLALAATRWRKRLQDARQSTDRSVQVGAFAGWKVILCVDVQREHGFKRLLQAGAAQVIHSRPPFTTIEGASHAFLDMNKIRKSAEKLVEMEDLVDNGVRCLKPEYIADYLMLDPLPEPDRYYVDEARVIMNW
ncbi:DNA topoisomerase 2-binding protein 1-A-like [Glandiceps talaboti]